MSSTAHAWLNERKQYLTEEQCSDILNDVRALSESYWIERDQLQVGRAVSDRSCSYRVTLNNSLPKELYVKLKALAPAFKPFELNEVVVNQYLPGDFISDHRDKDLYLVNLVIPLQTGTDGVVIEGELYPDLAGHGIPFKGTGPVHSVPAVQQERYVLIFLYW